MKDNNNQDQDYLKTLTLLYVEDDAEIVKQFIPFLKRPVGTLITAKNGMEGLEAFKTHRPDIVITDIQMPKMDGLAMAAEILGIAPSVPIIIITAFEQTDYLMRAIDIGIEKYVTKPVDSKLLFDRLYSCAHRLRAEEQIRLQHQREVQEARSKHHESYAILAGGIADDYSNLMHTIMGYATLAKIEIEPESRIIDHLENILKCHDSAEHLGKTLNLLVDDYSENTPPKALMPCISASIKKVLNKSSVEFSLVCHDALPDVSFNKLQMELVFAGLATNALESMPSGGSLQLTARLTEVFRDGGVPLNTGSYILVALADSGSGIDAEVMPRVFEPYFSTKHRSTKRETGLSLAMCQAIIMRHGGLIEAESTPGHGTLIRVWLPVAL
jgi:signal transduction histidine kinase